MTDDPAPRPTVVLVVDDSPETVSFLTTVLEDMGLMVLVALDGHRALKIARQVTPDIVLMDAVMPEPDGFETCRLLKEDESLAHVPVIFMTGLNEPEHVVRAFSVGGSDYVTKPIVVEEMLARMQVRQASAEATRAAHGVLDTDGKYLLSLGIDGAVRWATPQARRLLDEAGALERLSEVSTLARSVKEPNTRRTVDLGDLRFAIVAQLASADILLKVSRTTKDAMPSMIPFQDKHGLTARETEILTWLTRGKSNRDIADILGLSPRTIEKNFETIFRKLGVENRTAAAALAMREI